MDGNEIIKKLLRIDRLLANRKKQNHLADYNKDLIHEKQMAFHRCMKRNRWVFGGNRSGKTECGAAETIWLARGIHPFRENKDNINAWVVSLSGQVQRDVAQLKILHYLHPMWIEDIRMLSGTKGNARGGIIDYITIKNVFGGLSRIGFKSCDQGREKFQGTSLDFVWFDEEPPYDIYEECRMRIMDRAGHIFGTMTPLKGQSWVYDYIFLNSLDDSEVWHITMEWADNPYLPKGEIESLSKALPEDELRSRRYGEFKCHSGLVYGEFDQNVHVIEPFDVPKDWYDNISIDPGLNNPLSAHWYAVDYDGNVYVIYEHYEAGRDVSYHANKILEASDSLGWHRTSKGQLNALIDCAAQQRTLSGLKSVSELFYEHGISVNPKVNKELFAGIARVKEYLKITDGKPKLYIFNNCKNMIREMKAYAWSEGDTPRKTDDHAMDELRYYLMTKPSNVPRARPKSEITKHKERLAKRLRRI